MSTLPVGVYQTVGIPWWLVDVSGSPANILASTVTINSVPNGNITLTHNVSSSTEFNAPLIFQRPPADINAPSESLVMNTSTGVPTKPVDGEYITATKAVGSVYDDIAVAGLQVYGNQTTAGNSGAAAYITGSNGSLILAAQNSVYISSLIVSSFTATNVTSTATAASFTATVFMSTPIMNANVISSLGISTGVLQAGQLNILQNINTPSISTNTISTSQIVSKDIFTSTLTVSTLNAPNFVPSTVTTSTINSVFSDSQFSLTSTLSLFGNVDVNLGLGNQIAGLIGGAGAQALGVSLGGAGLITGAAALVSGRTSGGVNNSIFQTVNGSTQLQFSTIGSNISSIFLTTSSANPFTTPGLEIQQSQGVAAGTYCVRSVGDPLYINNNVSFIQMFGQWVPVIQPTATVVALAISSLGVSTSQSVTGNVSSLFVSSVNGAIYPPTSGTPTIPSTIALSTATFLGNVSSIGAGTFTWGGNSITPTQVTLSRPTAINNTLTTTGAAFLNAGATVNTGLTVASGGATITGNNLSVGGNVFASGVLQGGSVQALGGVTVAAGGIFVNSGGIQIQTGNFNMTSAGSVANITNLNVNQTINANLLRTNAISTTTISTNNINVFTINNQTYPPPSGSTTLPSTINASTINFDGGLNNVGSAPINTNTINTTNANVNFYVGNAINAASISTTTISTNTVFAANITTNTMNTTTTNANNIQASAISTNTLSTNLIRAAAISSFSISTNTLNVNTINGQPYTPGGGGGGITSTLNASTINVNGGINIANGGIINNSFEPIRTGFLSTSFISTGIITADTLRADFLSTAMIRADAVSTNFISCQTIRAQSISSIFISSQTTTASNIGCFQFSSLTASIRTLFVEGGNANSGVQFNDSGNVAGNIEAIGGTLTTYLDPTCSGFNIQNGYTYGVNTAFRLWGLASGFAGTGQFFSTLTVCQNPAGNPNEACVQTYNANTDPTPRGSVFTKAISTQTLQVSSINGLQIPQSLGVPVGSVMIWGGTTDIDPPGFYICDGRLLNISIDPALYAVIGNSYYNNYPTPIAPGTFYLPDLTFAIPQGAPKTNYQASMTVRGNYQPGGTGLINIMSNVPGVTPTESANRIWVINTVGAGTINVGTLIPSGQYPSQTVALYVQSIVQTDPSTGNPSIISVESVDGSFVPFLGVGNIVSINCVGIFRQPSPTQNFWLPGTFNELAFTNPGSNGPGITAPYKRNTRTQTGVEVGVHTHSYNRYGLFGSTGLANGNLDPSKASAFQQTAAATQNITDALGNTWAAPYPTKPNVLNMFYIIKY